MKLPRRRWWLLAALVVAFAAVLVWRARQPGDLERHLARLRAEGIPTTLAELDAWYPAVPDAENAGKLVLEAASGFRTTGDPALELDFSKRPGRTNTPPPDLLAADRAYLAANADTLAAIHAALAHPHSRYPVDLKVGFNTLLPHLFTIKGYTKQLGVCSEMAAENGQSGLAVQCLVDQLRLARTLESEPLFISFLVKNACESITTSAAERVLHYLALDDGELGQLQAAFSRQAATQSYERGMIGELCMSLDSLNQSLSKSLTLAGFGPGQNPDSFAFHANAAGYWLYGASGMRGRDVRAILDYCDQARRIARLPATRRRIEAERLNQQVEQQLRSHFLLFARMLIPSLERAEPKAARQYAVLRCAEVACAVERWRLAHKGALPPSLDALVPQFLAAVPEDPMDGKPLKFRPRPKGFVVYSIGEDGTDDGGKGPPHGTGGPGHWDYTFVVER